MIGRNWKSAAALGLIALLCPQTATAADRVVSADPSATDLSGFGDALVWSRQAGPGDFRLVQRRNGVVSDAPVRPFRHTVDADLGPGRSGGVFAVYARCATSRRCDLFRLDLASGREHKLRSLSSRGRPEFAASSWGGRYAFSRAARFSTAEREFEGFGIAGYRRAGLFKTGPLRRVTRRLPFETDLRGSRVAFRTGVASVASNTVVRVKAFRPSGRGRACTVVRAEGNDGLSSDDHVATSPILTKDHVLWAHTVSPGRFSGPASSGTSIHRAPVPDSRCRARGNEEVSRRIVSSPDRFSSIAIAGSRFFYTSPEGVKEATDPLGFGPR